MPGRLAAGAALVAVVLALTLACDLLPSTGRAPSPAAPLVTASPVGSPSPQAKVSNPPPSAFSESCALCHGGLGQGGGGGKLRGAALSLAQFKEKVRQGGDGMPPFDDSRLSEAQIEAIYRWLKDMP